MYSSITKTAKKEVKNFFFCLQNFPFVLMKNSLFLLLYRCFLNILFHLTCSKNGGIIHLQIVKS